VSSINNEYFYQVLRSVIYLNITAHINLNNYRPNLIGHFNAATVKPHGQIAFPQAFHNVQSPMMTKPTPAK